MRLLSPLFSLRAPTRALRRISSHSRRSFFASHSGVHGWRYHSPPLPYFFWRAGGNSTHSAVSSRPQWAQIWSSSLSTSAGLPLFPEEPLVPFPAPGSRLSIRSTPHPPSGSAFPHLQRPALHGPALPDEPELAVLLEALDLLAGLDPPPAPTPAPPPPPATALGLRPGSKRSTSSTVFTPRSTHRSRMLLTYPTRRASRSLAILRASPTASAVSPPRPQHP